jgi:3-carboxy-cis,cis-muconate cycloisomerase
MRPSSSTSDAADHPYQGGALLGPLFESADVSSQLSDEALLRQLLQTEADLALAAADVGIIPAQAAQQIAAAATHLDIDPRALGEAAVEAGNPVPVLVDRLTAAVSPDARAYVHCGATSQDILDTALGRCVTAAGERVATTASSTARELARLARRHRDTVLVARTLGQHAVPTTFGLIVAGWALGVHRGAEEVQHAVRRIPVQLGGAAGTLAGFGDDGINLAAALAARGAGAAPGPLPWHTDRWPWVQVSAACAQLVAAAGKAATDLVSLSATDVGEVSFDGGGSSSAMPHKQNPVDAVLIRADATRMPGLVATVLAASVHDGQRATGAWHAEWQPMRELLAVTGGAVYRLAHLTPKLRPRPDRMADNLARTHGAVMSESLTARLAPTLGRDEARSTVRRLIAAATETGRSLTEVAATDDTVTRVLPPVEIRAALDPASWLGSAGRMTDAVVAEIGERP